MSSFYYLFIAFVLIIGFKIKSKIDFLLVIISTVVIIPGMCKTLASMNFLRAKQNIIINGKTRCGKSF